MPGKVYDVHFQQKLLRPGSRNSLSLEPIKRKFIKNLIPVHRSPDQV